MMIAPEHEPRFWSNVFRQEEGCWMWEGWPATPNAYGGFQVVNKKFLAHRVAYALTKGAIPAGMFVCHHCDNPKCVRPDHLFLGTPLDNMRDMHRKGRARSGNAKLNPDAVRDIRSAHSTGMGYRRLARKHGVAVNAVVQVLRGDTWTHVQ